MNQNFPLAFHGMGTAHFALGRYEEALSSFRKTLQLDPSSKDAIIMISTCEILIGNAEKAIPRLESLRNKDPLNQMALFTLAVAYFCAGKKEIGLGIEKELNKLKFNSDTYYSNFAKLLICNKRIRYAIALLEAVSKMGTVTDESRDLLSLCYQMNQLADG
jgi:tetratricopeptide (TPR) repeat protein